MSASAPRICVLLPARNAAATLGEAVEGVLAQEGAPPFELFIVDDGSSDGTFAIAERFSRRDPRVRVLRGPGTGLVAALNFGLEQISSPFIARMDADDLVHPSRLRLQSAWLDAHPQAAAVGSLVRIAPQPLSPGLERLESWLNSVVSEAECRAARFIESPLVHPSILFRKAALDAVGRYRDAGWAEDWDLLLRLFERGYSLGKVREVLLDWRDSPGRLTRTGAVYRTERMIRLRAHFLARGPLAGRKFEIWGAGPTGKQLARALEAHERFPERFIDVDPRKKIARGKPVLPAAQLGPPSGAMLLCAVGAAGARAEIRAMLDAQGYAEERDYLFTA